MRWQAYFSIYPFTQDREDLRHAQLISMLTFISSLTAQNKGLKKPIPVEDLLPDYLGAKDAKQITEKSLETQREEFAKFMKEYQAAKDYAQGKVTNVA